MLVGEIVVGEFVHQLVRAAIRDVVGAQPPLLLHRLALVVELGLGHRLRQRAHPVRLQVEPQVQLVGRQRLEVVGPVLVGGAVHVGAVGRNQGEELALGNLWCALEHQMFEQVGETGVPFALVARTHIVGQAKGDGGGAAVGRENHPQPIRQRGLLQRQPDRRGRRRLGGQAGGQQADQADAAAEGTHTKLQSRGSRRFACRQNRREGLRNSAETRANHRAVPAGGPGAPKPARACRPALS